MSLQPLPIDRIAPEVVGELTRGRRLVISAPTGSGKSTRVPGMVLDALGGGGSGRASGAEAPGLGGRVLVLQPRRVAARMLAARVAMERNTRLGEEVGYITRHERAVSDRSSIVFITEGLLPRMLQDRPGLPGVGAVVLDEFHERTLTLDLSLALIRRLQESRRPDLRLVVMSATLDTRAVGGYLDCPVLESHGRSFEVRTTYLSRQPAANEPVWALAAEALSEALEGGEAGTAGGDVLIFMPGAYEIRRTMDACRWIADRHGAELHALHGEMPAAEQDRALAVTDRRKVIVATNVAETSLTIPGVTGVIDSGLAKVHRYDPRRGINVLLTEPISVASADQRAGRAGRTSPGRCLRLWTPAAHRGRPAQTLPEIRRVDLAEAMLSIKALGVDDPAGLDWLEAPDGGAMKQAAAVLHMLGATEQDQVGSRLTGAGRAMAAMALHPRLGRVMVEAERRGCAPRAALWCALIAEREIVRDGGAGRWEDESPHGRSSDLVALEAAYRAAERARFDPERCQSLGLHPTACREVERSYRQLHDPRRSRQGPGAIDADTDVTEAIRCLLAAYPDHVGIRRTDRPDSAAMVGHRRSVVIDRGSVVQRPGLFLALDLREGAAGGRGRPSGMGRSGPGATGTAGAGVATVRTEASLLSEVRIDWLRELHPDRLRTEHVTEWSPSAQAVMRIERTLFDGLSIEETHRPEADAQRAAPILARRIAEGTLRPQTWDEEVEQWIARTRCVGQWFAERRLIGYDADDMQLVYEELCRGATRWSEVRERSCLEAVRGVMSWEDRDFVERMAPSRIALPRGWKMRMTYLPGGPPRGRAKIQDLYGLDRSPTVAGGRVTVTLEILGPNQRPLQVTDDLANFWRELYPKLRNELRRRYPRHEWR